MKLLTWNIRHGGGTRCPSILERLRHHSPDLIVLTEFRNGGSGERLRGGLHDIGLDYQHASTAPPKVNTLLIASRRPFAIQPHLVPHGVDSHRCLTVLVEDLRIIAVYFAQNTAKLSLFQFLLGLPAEYPAQGTVIIGDFNTGRHRIDERGKTFVAADLFEKLEQVGWIDAWRLFHADEQQFSWFSHKGGGFRIDHAFISSRLRARAQGAEYSHVEREEGISDHSLLTLTLV